MTIRIILQLCVLAGSIVSVVTGYAACSVEDSEIREMPIPDCQEFVRQCFISADYGCGIHAVRLKAGAVDALSGVEGIDARFALRELALELTRNIAYPPEERIKLLQAATITGINGEAARKKEELQSDSSMLWRGASLFRIHKDASSGLDTLVLAIRQDQRRSDADRSLGDYYNWGGGYPPDLPLGHNEAKNHLGQLVAIAKEVRNDNTLKSLKSKMVELAYFDSWIWEKEVDHKIILERAQQLLVLVEELNGTTCHNCNCGPDWNWRAINRAGLAFHLIGMTEEAEKNVDRAIQIAQSTKDPNSRLCKYNFLFYEILSADYTSSYNPKTIGALIAEMETLANSMDTGLAKDVRQSLPERVGSYTDRSKKRK